MIKRLATFYISIQITKFDSFTCRSCNITTVYDTSHSKVFHFIQDLNCISTDKIGLQNKIHVKLLVDIEKNKLKNIVPTLVLKITDSSTLNVLFVYVNIAFYNFVCTLNFKYIIHYNVLF